MESSADRMGPWGFGDAVVLLSPIGFLVAMVLKPNPMPTSKSLWLAAVLLFVLKLWYLQASPLEACACFVKGVLQALTPCSIVAGAIFLFDCMESSQCLAWMKVQLRVVTDSHPVAEVMLIGFCFAFVVEGASGFGTPAALAAPMLHSMGHPKMECVVCLLTFNTFMTIFGAVGTPVWFGIGEVVLDYGEENLMQVGFNAAIALSICAILIVPFVVNIIVPKSDLMKSLPFVFMSTLSIVLPFIGLAFVNYEFPTLASGIFGLLVTTLLTVFRVGLGAHSKENPEPDAGPELKEALEDAEPKKEISKEFDLEKGKEGKEDKDVTVATVATDLEIVPQSEMKSEMEIDPVDGVTFSNPSGDVTKALTKVMAQAKAQESEGGALKTTMSKKSLKDKAVNPQVEVCKKTLKKFHKGRHMAIMPTRLWRAHHSENSDFETPSRTKKIDIDDAHLEHFNQGLNVFDCVFRTMPLWLTVLLLILTRIEPIGLKSALRLKEPTIVNGDLGTLGHLEISAVGRFSLSNILGTNIGWAYELLYIPFILPFVVAGCAPLLVFRRELEHSFSEIVHAVLMRIKGPAIALSGALMLVELLRTSDHLKDAPATIIGTRLSETLSHAFVALSFPLGALGSFFSGSTTVSNLTFTQVQKVAAEKLGLTSNALIALQLCGASSGNAFCLSNIIAATAVIGLHIPEGIIVKRVLKPVFAQYLICTLVLLPFIYA